MILEQAAILLRLHEEQHTHLHCIQVSSLNVGSIRTLLSSCTWLLPHTSVDYSVEQSAEGSCHKTCTRAAELAIALYDLIVGSSPAQAAQAVETRQGFAEDAVASTVPTSVTALEDVVPTCIGLPIHVHR